MLIIATTCIHCPSKNAASVACGENHRDLKASWVGCFRLGCTWQLKVLATYGKHLICQTIRECNKCWVCYRVNITQLISLKKQYKKFSDVFICQEKTRGNNTHSSQINFVTSKSMLKCSLRESKTSTTFCSSQMFLDKDAGKCFI